MVSGSNKCDHRQGGNHKQRDRRAKILPIVLLLALFALTIWRLRHSLPTYVYAALADPRLMDHDTPNQVTNISTFVPLLYLRHNSLPPAKDTNTTITAKVTSKLQTPLPEVQEKAHDENNDLRKVNVTKDPKILREEFEIACNHNDIKSLNRKGLRQLLYGHLNAMFVPPATLEALMGEEDPVQPCMYTFLDLGANIGDSLGKFIDAGFPMSCGALKRINKRARYSIDHGKMVLGDSGSNDLTNFCARAFQLVSRGPEDYCYVGVEGNPVFTLRLKQMEARVKGTILQPTKAAHFYTETVAAGVDGPTFLYLDQHNIKENFWGSSILSTHIDAKREFVQQGNRTIKAPVMGLTLTTLLKRSVEKTKGAHVIMKIDIEGGEYPVMNEAIGTLCDYTKAGVRVDLILETHGEYVLGGENADMTLFFNETQQRLKDCKINTGDLSAWGGQ